MIPIQVKFIIAIAWDFLDFTLGRIPIFGTFFDFAGLLVTMMLWGVPGLIAFWEVIDITDQFDAVIPTTTMVGLVSLWMGWNK